MRQAFGAEENPSENGKRKRNNHRKEFFKARKQTALRNIVKVVSIGRKNNRRHDVQRIEETPNQERPVRAMPKSADNENNKRIPDFHPHAAFAAAKWNVQIIAEPGRERNVPSAPEFGNVAREIRERKISQELNPEKP